MEASTAAPADTVKTQRQGEQAMGQTIKIQTPEGSFSGYLAVPAAGKGPGIVLCQEIFGVNATMRQVADYYAEEGYTVLVPDLFWRLAPGIELSERGEDFQRALGLYQQFDEAKGVQDVGAALETLRARPE